MTVKPYRTTLAVPQSVVPDLLFLQAFIALEQGKPITVNETMVEAIRRATQIAKNGMSALPDYRKVQAERKGRVAA